jgi:predicted DNA-binding antitoxin AbrB/MazE fold protein
MLAVLSGKIRLAGGRRARVRIRVGDIAQEIIKFAKEINARTYLF